MYVHSRDPAFHDGPEIILLTAGSDYEQSVLPFRIIIFQVIFIGLAQILENQILLSLKKFKEVLICTAVSTFLSIIILLYFTSRYAEVAAAYAVAVPHVLEMLLLYKYAKKSLDISFPFKEYSMHIIACVPIVIFCIAIKLLFSNYILVLLIGCSISCVYYLLIEYYVVKQQMIVSQIDGLLLKTSHFFK